MLKLQGGMKKYVVIDKKTKKYLNREFGYSENEKYARRFDTRERAEICVFARDLALFETDIKHSVVDTSLRK